MLSILITLLISTITHPLFISMTQVEYNSATKNIEVSVRVFTDDFESALRKNSSIKIDLTHPKDKKSIDEQINKYILNNLSMRVNGIDSRMQYVGYEIIQESVWAYFEAPVEKMPKALSMQNNILYDFSTKQINLVQVKIGKEERTEKRSYPENLFNFQF